MTNVLDAQQAKAASIGRAGFLTAKNISYIVLAAAIGVSGYLSYLKFASVDAICVAGGAFDCGTVLNSVYSEFFGIPIAWLGLATNLVIVALLTLENRVTILREIGTLIVFGVLLFAFIYSVYLVYLQAFVIRAYCPWCLTHEALIAILFFTWTPKAIQAFRNA
jgi:uncharacterized membrane protein